MGKADLQLHSDLGDGLASPEQILDAAERARGAAWLNSAVVRAAETGSSDAHHAELVGTCWTEFEGRTADDLRRAIAARTTSAHGRTWTVAEHLGGAATQQWRSMVRDPIKRARRRIGQR